MTIPFERTRVQGVIDATKNSNIEFAHRVLPYLYGPVPPSSRPRG
jgi:hypothetical protein